MRTVILGSPMWLVGRVLATAPAASRMPRSPGLRRLPPGTRLLLLEPEVDPEVEAALQTLKQAGLRVRGACRLRTEPPQLLYWALAPDGSAEVGTLPLGEADARRTCWEGLRPWQAELRYHEEQKWRGTQAVVEWSNRSSTPRLKPGACGSSGPARRETAGRSPSAKD